MGKPLSQDLMSSDFGTAEVIPPRSIEQCRNLLNDLLETEPAELGRKDLGLLNLLCAPSLPGSENLDIPKCLARLDQLAGFVKASTERNLYRFKGDPDFGHSEPMWRMALLVTNVKLDFGAAYDPAVRADLERDGRSPFADSRNAFIHGLLSDDAKRRWGSCSSIPVLVAAVARRLGYPVRLAVNRKHIWLRWDDGRGVSFNVTACPLVAVSLKNMTPICPAPSRSESATSTVATGPWLTTSGRW